VSHFEWKFRATPPDGERKGGDLAAMSFERDLETFVREVIQNSHDAKHPNADTVRVLFRFEELEGAKKRAFLDAAGWEQLAPHLKAASERMPILKESVHRTESGSQPLIVLGVHDASALGLSGPEKGAKGRFANFARNKLISEKQGTSAGGSFGLGKSVLWTFSGWHTVFAHSLPDGEPKSRFIGISQLPFHALGKEDLDGPGWYGRLKGAIWATKYAESVWKPSSPLMDALRLKREVEWKTGTSVLIPDFLAPEGGSAASLGQKIRDAAARWFWPLIAEGGLQVDVEVDGKVQSVIPKEQAELAPWLHLANRVTKPSWKDVTYRKVIELPVANVRESQKERDDVIHHKKRTVAEALEVAVVQADDLPQDSVGTIALVRGSGMIIKIMTVRADRPFVGLVRAGVALGDTHEHQIVEQFLRAAEPPSHNDWTKTAPKLADLYGAGYKGTLDALPGRIREIAATLVRSRDTAGTPDVLPRILQKSLSLSQRKGAGLVSKKGRFDYGIDSCELFRDHGQTGWKFQGWVSSSYAGPWGFVVECALHGDSEAVALKLGGLEVAAPAKKAGMDRARLLEPGQVRFDGFAPLDEFGRLGDEAMFQVQLRRQRIRPSRGGRRR
jgi:hypothetical protein